MMMITNLFTFIILQYHVIYSQLLKTKKNILQLEYLVKNLIFADWWIILEIGLIFNHKIQYNTY